MEISHAVEGSTGSVAGRLYEAAMTGSVDTLDILLEVYGRAVLFRISLTSFADTPLHLAALLGHLEFSKRLLQLSPELASEQDSEKCTPLHLAAANGHDQVVRELLRADEKACLVQDKDGRVPLHLAAMRGRLQVVRELLSSNLGKASLKMKVDDGDGILHLCVKYNHLDVLKAVLASTGGDDREILKMTDSHGNTVLHLAVMLKQSETVRFLLELPRVKAEVVNTTNAMELTALDILNHSPKDYKSLEIREILIIGAGAGTVRLAAGRADWARPDEVGALVEAPAKTESDQVQKCWSLWEWACHHVNRLMDYRGDWMNKTKGSLMMVSTIIATVTFNAGIAPPGGVWQADTYKSFYKNKCASDNPCVAGNAVLAYYYPEVYIKFMKYDMISFISSLAVVFLLISGFPLSNKFTLWLLSLFMCVTVSFLGLTFLEALWLVIPGGSVLYRYDRFKSVSLTVWEVMMCIVGLTLLVRLSSWLRRMNISTLFKAGRKRLRGHGSCNPYA